MINVENKIDCCGCSACESICSKDAISLMPDTEGFLYPIVDLSKCIDCHICEKVCPVIYRKNNSFIKTFKELYAVRHKSADILQNSSSGGFFSALANYVLKKGGVVFGVVYDINMIVKHVAIERCEDLWKLRGSKYVQSELKGIFNQVKVILNSGRLVLFSGTPCQVEGLNLFLRKKYSNLITVDLVCHAVTSPKLFSEYINYIEKKFKRKVEWLNMRDKFKTGWNHHFIMRIRFKGNKSTYLKRNMYSWLSIFGSEMASRPSCHSCSFTNKSRPGDFTIADFWDDKRLRPDIYSDKGTSLCIINTAEGTKIMKELKQNLYYWNISEEEAWQPCLESPTLAHEKRDEFWEVYLKSGFMKAYRKFIYIPIRIRVIWRVKDFIAKIIGYKRNSSL